MGNFAILFDAGAKGVRYADRQNSDYGKEDINSDDVLIFDSEEKATTYMNSNNINGWVSNIDDNDM